MFSRQQTETFLLLGIFLSHPVKSFLSDLKEWKNILEHLGASTNELLYIKRKMLKT
jgi:hypothetical protein